MSLYDLANEWLTIDEAEKKLAEQRKLLRDRKKELTVQLIPLLKDSGELGIDEYTKIEYKTRTSKSLGKKNMIAILSEKTNLTETKARALVELMYDNRPEKEVPMLKVHTVTSGKQNIEI